ASQAVDEHALYTKGEGPLVLPASARAAAEQHLRDYPPSSGRTVDIHVTSVSTAGDGTVHVVVAAATHPPLAGWFTRGTGIAVPPPPPAPPRPHRRLPRRLGLPPRRRPRPRGPRGGDPPAPGRMVHTGDRHRRPADRRRRGPRPMTPPRTAPAVLIAPDKFKGSLSAAEVTTALTHGIHRAAPHTAVLSCPIADGGDGTVDAALAAGSTAHSITVTGPTGEARRSRYAL